jgi:Protein of unknown function (DUF2786)
MTITGQVMSALPVVIIGGKSYFSDERLHEYRAVDNPHERIPWFDPPPNPVEVIPVGVRLVPLPKSAPPCATCKDTGEVGHWAPRFFDNPPEFLVDHECPDCPRCTLCEKLIVGEAPVPANGQDAPASLRDELAHEDCLSNAGEAAEARRHETHEARGPRVARFTSQTTRPMLGGREAIRMSSTYTRDEVMAKIRKCLALAQGAGTPEEAAAAASKARELQDAHQIEVLTLEEKGAEKEAVGEELVAQVRERQGAWDGSIVVAVAADNGCECLWSWRRNRVTFENQKFHIVFGRASDVAVCKELIRWLISEIERLSHDASWLKGATARNSFKRGAADAVIGTIRRLRRERTGKLQAGSVEAGQHAMVLAGRDLVARAFQTKYPSLTKGKASRPTHDSSAYSAGHAAGSGLSTRRDSRTLRSGS